MNIVNQVLLCTMIEWSGDSFLCKKFRAVATQCCNVSKGIKKDYGIRSTMLSILQSRSITPSKLMPYSAADHFIFLQAKFQKQKEHFGEKIAIDKNNNSIIIKMSLKFKDRCSWCLLLGGYVLQPNNLRLKV